MEPELLAALTRIGDALEGIRQVLEVLALPPDADPDRPCDHPLELRTDFGLTGGVSDWQCACGYRSLDAVAQRT